MPWLGLLLLVFAELFWQSKPPAEWNDVELAQFLADSPWAQMAAAPGKTGTAPAVQIYLATAGPIERAVEERNRRIALRQSKAATESLLGEEFAAWFADNRAEHVIVAARVGNNSAFSSESETRHLQDSAMDLGRFKVKMSSYFPPTVSDPHLYLAFPRGQASPADKSVAFELYLPGVSGPFRTVQFKVKDMLVDGKLEL